MAGVVPQYTTTNGSASVKVTLPTHGLSVGQTFDAVISTTLGGVTVFGSYAVATVINANQFTIIADAVATGNASAFENGGNARIEYLLPSGNATNASTGGYGVGDYGSGDYGLSDSGVTVRRLRQWSIDHWGQDLIASPSNGAIYYWVPPNIQPAITVPNSPLYSSAVFVMSEVQILVSLGAETSGTQEPLLVRWSDEGDFTDWTATATNQAGSYFFSSSGSAIIGGLAAGLQAFIWTDTDIWSMTYLSFPLVFGFTRVATGCGLISQRAAGTVGPLLMWLSPLPGGFFQMQIGGGMQPIECPVLDFILDNIDTTQLDQVFCATNSLFNEMAWHFPISPSSPIYATDAPIGYVKINYLEQCWDYGLSGQYQRTAWTDRSPVGNPTGTDLHGLVQQHEIGFDANGSPMIGGWRTGYFDVAEGEDFPFIDLIVPDFVFDSTTGAYPAIQLTAYGVNYPFTLFNQGPLYTAGPFTVSPNLAPGAGSTFMSPRIRARQIAIGASWSDQGTFNRLGAIRYRWAPDGRL